MDGSDPDFKALFESAPGLYLVLSPDLKIVAVSDAYLAATMTARDKILGRNLFDVFPDNPDDPKANGVRNLKASLKRVVKEKASDAMAMQKYDIRRPEEEGGGFEERHWSPANFPVFDSHGELRYIIHCVEDATEFMRAKQKEEEHAKIARDSQAQKMESIGRLAGGVAHDFNNMLTAILGISQVAMEELPKGHSVRRDIEEIEKTARRAAELTRQLLAFSRKQIFEPRIVDLNELILNLEKLLRRILGEDIELIILPSSKESAVRVDPSQFEQVIVNLAVNARDAMPGGGKLMIETSLFQPDEDFAAAFTDLVSGRSYVVLSISDTGVGMSDGVRRQLFEPFFTTKEKGKGTGLGLATCYGIVRQNGGTISVYSREGKGATFQVYLPVSEGRPDAPVQVAQAADIPRGDETILLVEDELAVRALASRVLKRFGYQVIEVGNGEEALRVVSGDFGKKIRLIITDVVMPIMGGKRLAEAAAQLRPDIAILFTSGYTDEDISRHGALVPGILFLSKPFMPDALARKVREAIDNKK